MEDPSRRVEALEGDGRCAEAGEASRLGGARCLPAPPTATRRRWGGAPDGRLAASCGSSFLCARLWLSFRALGVPFLDAAWAGAPVEPFPGWTARVPSRAWPAPLLPGRPDRAVAVRSSPLGDSCCVDCKRARGCFSWFDLPARAARCAPPASRAARRPRRSGGGVCGGARGASGGGLVAALPSAPARRDAGRGDGLLACAACRSRSLQPNATAHRRYGDGTADRRLVGLSAR